MLTVFVQTFVNVVFFIGVSCDYAIDGQHHHSSATTPAAEKPQRLSHYCKPEVFHHDYIADEGKLENVENSWNIARVNQWGSLKRICLQPNGMPVTRKCLFDPQLGAVWEPIGNWTRIKCIEKPQQRVITSELKLLHERSLEYHSSTELEMEMERPHPTTIQSSGREIIQNLFKTLEKPKTKFLPADVYHTAETLHYIFEYTKDREVVSPDIVGIFNTVMSMNHSVLRRSAAINSTNNILNDFENFMDVLGEQVVPSKRCHSKISLRTSIPSIPSIQANSVETVDFSNIGIYAHLTSDVSVFFINPSCANISGIAIYDYTSQTQRVSFESRGNGKFRYRFIYKNETAEDLMKESGLQIASFVPENLWRRLTEKFDHLREPTIVIKVYSHDSLFVQIGEKQSCSPSSKIISISIPGFSGRFPEPLPLLMRYNGYNRTASKKPPSAGSGCGYWNYQTWLRDDIRTAIPRDITDSPPPVVLCFTGHLTQFSYIVGGQYRYEDLGEEDILITPLHIRALDIITLIGCSLSLMGLLGIWITAGLFPNWRAMSSTKVLLHLCFALTVQMILFLFVNTHTISENLIREKSYYGCVAVGALLQYSILVLFAWMLIIALLQFQRYVTVIGIDRPHRYILKSAITAWGVPLIPTLIVALVNPEGYIPSDDQFDSNSGVCYPTGYGLAFGVILPITVVCIANLTIFVFVFYSISNTLQQSMPRQEKVMVKNQIRLSILLFFLLGICWIFGALAYFNHSIIFSYLFCLTATLQGFIIFLYFVILSDVPRNAWRQLLCPQKQARTIGGKEREMQSITASSAIESGTSDRQK